MSKFKKKGSGELPKISTASLPDIVFMLLFFFMVATVLRDNTLLIQNTLPAADQVQKLDKKDQLSIFLNAFGKLSIKSVAIKDSSPNFFFEISPDNPCMYTPIIIALKGL